jgi:hypothetical protein
MEAAGRASPGGLDDLVLNWARMVATDAGWFPIIDLKVEIVG